MTPLGDAIVCDDTAIALKTRNLRGVDVAEFIAQTSTPNVGRAWVSKFQRAHVLRGTVVL